MLRTGLTLIRAGQILEPVTVPAGGKARRRRHRRDAAIPHGTRFARG